MSARSILAAFMLAGLALSFAPASAADGQMVEVPLDVDVYGTPGDESTKRSQFLKKLSQVKLLQQRSDHWCRVASGKDPVPGGPGWIWCGKGNDKQEYYVKPVAAEKPETDNNMQVVEAKCPEGMEIEVNGPPLICREKVADGTTKCTEVTVVDGQLVLKPIGQCPAM